MASKIIVLTTDTVIYQESWNVQQNSEEKIQYYIVQL